ncbi:glycosyltransferase family 2 protein [Methanolobus sp. ZRKC2]|uniref:glycosyltransferase family 2 protein n=1 Tax=Methanolobus sp. ZRKC2 TaxID=3125783 RepID=UPI003244B867
MNSASDYKKSNLGQPSLLIYIPSFNRFELLLKKIKVLSPQVDGVRTRLVISDNCSTDNRYLELNDFVDSSKVDTIRRNSNKGIAGNILHAFDEKFGDFVWILSDDDDVFPDSVEKITDSLDYDCDLIYLRSNIKGEKNIKSIDSVTTKKEFFTLFSGLSMTGLISSNVYNKSKINESTHIGYLFCSNLFPHTAMFLNQISDQNSILIKIIDDVVKWHFGEITYSSSYFRAWVSYLDLVEIVEEKYRYKFIKKFLFDWAYTHYIPVCYNSNNLLKYIYYSLKYPKSFIWFSYFLLTYPLYWIMRKLKIFTAGILKTILKKNQYDILKDWMKQ